jgi:predicted amidohydrolase
MTDATMAVAVAQFSPTDDTAANLAEISRLAVDAASRGALLVVFPEYSSYFTPTMGQDWVDAAQSLHGPFVRGIGEISQELGIHLVAGMLEVIPNHTDKASNTIVAVDPDGEVIAHYRKTHLFDAFGKRESDWIIPGIVETPHTFEVGGFTVGMQTCYDIRFPEVTRHLVDAGVDLVVLPSQWLRGPLKESAWRTLITARALENTIYLAAAGQAPPTGAGNSMVVDPMGVELVTVGENTDVAVAWISPERLAQVRHINPALELRRFSVQAR